MIYGYYDCDWDLGFRLFHFAHRRIEKDTVRAKKATVSESEHILKMTRTYKRAVIGIGIDSSSALRLKELPEVRWRPEEVRVAKHDLSWLAL